MTVKSAEKEHRPSTDGHMNDRLSWIASEIRAILRRSPALTPAPVSIDGSERMLALLAETAVHHVAVGEFEEARRAIGDAAILFDDVRDESVRAHAALLCGEALVELDSPEHAKRYLERAMEAFNGAGGEPGMVLRATLALGRALLALEHPDAHRMLDRARTGCSAAGDQVGVARVDAILEDAQRPWRAVQRSGTVPLLHARKRHGEPSR